MQLCRLTNVKSWVIYAMHMLNTRQNTKKVMRDSYQTKKLTKNQLFDLAERQSLKIKKSGTKAQVINEIHSQLK